MMEPEPASTLTSRRLCAAVLVLCLLGTLRALALWAHEPLYAYANSYDQTRYTSCFHFYPDRPADVPPQQNSPAAPFSRYRFIATDDPMCYWSSELVFTAATALAWKTSEALGAGAIHDVRWVGALRWLAVLAIGIALSLAWLRRGQRGAALANAALVPLLFADPGNTLYLNTFYAEWSALIAVYAVISLLLLWRDEPGRWWQVLLIALAAFALATAKIQHLLLPLALVVALVALDRLRLGRIGWRAAALAFGACAGLALQVVQLQRDGAMMDAIDQYNRADVVFTALLPFAEDRRALLVELGIDPACAIYSGHHAWEFPGLPEDVCTGLEQFDRGDELAILLRHPGIAFRLAAHGVLALDPWIAKNLGEVEGGDFALIPSSVPTIGRCLHAQPRFQWILLALPFLGIVLLLVRRDWRRGGRRLEFTALIVTTMLATLVVTVLGDGLADVAKQGHLVVNAALAWLVVAIGAVSGKRKA